MITLWMTKWKILKIAWMNWTDADVADAAKRKKNSDDATAENLGTEGVAALVVAVVAAALAGAEIKMAVVGVEAPIPKVIVVVVESRDLGRILRGVSTVNRPPTRLDVASAKARPANAQLPTRRLANRGMNDGDEVVPDLREVVPVPTRTTSAARSSY